MKEKEHKKLYKLKCYNMVNNQSLKFLLPLIGDRYSPKFYMNPEFIGCFIGDIHNENKDGDLLLVYKYPATIEWARYEAKLMDIPTYSGDYDYGDKGYVVYAFSLDEVEDDFEHIMDGKYSEVSPESKLKIVKFWESKSGLDLAEKILNKDESLYQIWMSWGKDPKEHCEEGELWFKPDINTEIFNKDYKY